MNADQPSLEKNTIQRPEMNHTTKPNYQELLQFIQDSDRSAARERVSVKAKVLVDYLRPTINPDPFFEDFADAFIASFGKYPAPNDPLVFRDEDGDLALAQPYAEMFLLSGARHFNGALGLILMVEACYEPMMGDPGSLRGLLDKYRPLVMDGGLPSLVTLHEFLEIDEDVGTWFSEHLRRHRLVLGRDYLMLPQDACGDSTRMREVSKVHLEPFVAAKLAVATRTIRGRKLRGCLVDPRVNSFDFAELDPALLELLLTPPARGLASL